ncbi:MAG: BON domain-containing protein [Dehalococcoidia bacterium]|nr:BON domain-containing protein [Dehalococcoidia bacterium]
MHDILLPSRRRTRLRNARRYPDEAAFLARLPLLGDRVPLRPYWRRRPVRPARLWRQMLRSSPIFGGLAQRFLRDTSGGDAFGDLGNSAMSAARDGATTARCAADDAITRGKKWQANLRDSPSVRAGAQRTRQAAIAATLAGQRMRGMMDAARARRAAKRTAAAAGERAPKGNVERQKLGRDVGKRGRKRSRGSRRSAMFIGVAIGAMLMYWFDSMSGRRRRALVRDRFAHIAHIFSRQIPDRLERRGRFLRGVARGLRHDATSLLPNGDRPAVDDETLVDRVRSEVLRGHGIKAGEIHLDAYAGVVTLRGQLQYPDQIRRLIEDTSRTEGVRQVRSYLHLPGTLAPNKAEIYELQRDPRGSTG